MVIPDFLAGTEGLVKFLKKKISMNGIRALYVGTFLPSAKNLTADPDKSGFSPTIYVTLLPTYTDFKRTGEARAELTVRIISQADHKVITTFWDTSIDIVNILTSPECVDTVNYVTRIDCTSFNFAPWENAGTEFYSATALFDVYLQMK